MPQISLRKITVENWKQCASLTVSADQVAFVPNNLYSIAEAQFYPKARSRAIYNAADVMVGYALFGIDVVSGRWKVFRLMVDASFQRCGYGHAVMRAIVAEVSIEPDGDELLICYQSNNNVARRLYASLGFIEQTDDDGVVTALLKTTLANVRRTRDQIAEVRRT